MRAYVTLIFIFENSHAHTNRISDGHRIFAELHRRLNGGGNVEQHVITCSKLYVVFERGTREFQLFRASITSLKVFSFTLDYDEC